MMKTEISIPKDLLAQIDFANTISGGMVENKAQAWRDEKGYRLVLDAPSVEADKIQVQVANQRFMIYYFLPVLEGTEALPYFLVNLPMSPEVDIERLTVKYENGRVYVKAPFNDWALGNSRFIDMDTAE
jgi:hypothetical protein